MPSRIETKLFGWEIEVGAPAAVVLASAELAPADVLDSVEDGRQAMLLDPQQQRAATRLCDRPWHRKTGPTRIPKTR
ncbi:hypothetical protein [Ensifer aridi]|uniref:hypothetical protein n=1 Tax=Ensifer aridi TaxID=1708715 RepID=UPI0015E3B8EB|nr:hypothetical protein [Ensifer aridi]